MRIGIFHTTLPEPGRKPGGVEVYVERLARRLAGRGHRVKVFSFTAAPADAPYEHVKLRPSLMARSRAARLLVAPILLNRLDTADLDVLHLHGDDWFLLRRRLPTVRTFHGSSLYESRTATSLKRRLSQALVYPLELLASRLATRSYAVAPGMPRLYRLHGMLHCGVDSSNGSLGRSETPSVLFVGTWEGRKRGRLLAELFEREVRPRVPDAELWLVADRGEPAAGVQVIRAPSDAELAELFERAWVFCLPSEYEGFGIPYIEAMSHGAAVVATANPGARYVLEEGRSGMTVTDGELAGALVEVLTDEALRRRLVEEGARRAREFSWDSSLASHEAAYEAAIAAWRAGRGRAARRFRR
ncbi:MAG TPA: glycosyltransferase family 4 protein [Thermoleophilaceae bacterium]|nr:glycosyltransferase family 4 protein [Thermoleophilaceae bacterium]